MTDANSLDLKTTKPVEILARNSMFLKLKDAYMKAYDDFRDSYNSFCGRTKITKKDIQQLKELLDFYLLRGLAIKSLDIYQFTLEDVYEVDKYLRENQEKEDSQ